MNYECGQLNDDDSELIRSNIQKIVDHCLKITLRLVRLSDDKKEIIGIASGFIYGHKNNYYIISAGHALEKSSWVIETNICLNTEKIVVCIPINFVWQIERFNFSTLNSEEIDFAWAKIDFDKFKAAIKQDPKLKGKIFEFDCYHGPLTDEPEAGEAYSFAS